MANNKVIKYNKTVLMFFLMLSGHVRSEDQFSTHALELDNPGTIPADISQFSSPGGQLPGEYLVDIYVNDNKTETRKIKFNNNETGGISPEISKRELAGYGVKVEDVQAIASLSADSVVTPIEKYIPGASVRFVFSKQKLEISIPQALISHSARGYISPEFWDEGIPAVMTSYDFNGSSTSAKHSNSSDDESYFLNLHSGINIDAWRIRNYSTWHYNKTDDNTEQEWDSINSWAQRDIKSLKGQLILGDTYTSSELFDSYQFEGGQLVSDDNMLPDSQRGFAPVIRGIAQSNAKITVRQNNTVVYQTNVSPGPFMIDDLYPASSGGDLVVTITESDGSKRSFTQAFSSVPAMQREGRLKYAYTAGKYRSSSDNGYEPEFGQFTLFYGLPGALTIYGGMQYAEHYSSYAFGLGSDLGELGSVSIDAANAYSELVYDGKDDDKRGQSYRFQYMKNIEETSSTVSIAGYRYSTSGYYSFNEANDIYSYSNEDDAYEFYHNKKNKFQINFTQEIMEGEWGSLSLDGYQQNYWGIDGYDRSLSVGYNTSYHSISYGVNYTYSIYPDDQNADQQFSFNVSIPFSAFASDTDMYLNYNLLTRRKGDTTQQVGFNGTALEDNNLDYSFSQGYSNHSENLNGQLSGDYKGRYGKVGAGYNYDNDSEQINYNAEGSVIAHQYGVTFGQALSGDMSSIVLVRAPGADDVKIRNNVGVRTDWRGYTVVPYVSAYRKSSIELTTEDLGDSADLESNVYGVVPTQGALVLANFKTHIGKRAIATLKRPDGTIIPFGAIVNVEGDDRESIVSDDGQVYLTGLGSSGNLNVVWGRRDNQNCNSHFELENGKDSGVASLNLECK